MGITELRNSLKGIVDTEYDVDVVIMALLVINYKIIDLVKEEFNSDFVSWVLDEVEDKLNLDTVYTEDVIDCALNNLAAIRTITLYESGEYT